MVVRRTPVWIGAALFVLVWLSCAWFGSWERNPNHAVRLFAAMAIVEEGSATIDRYEALTIDKARFGDHFYSDKAPGMTIMALPAVALANAWTGERGAGFTAFDDGRFDRFLRLRLWLAAATGPALLTALAAMLVWHMALVVTRSPGAALFAGLGYGLGTPAWGWSTTLFGHAAVAGLLFVAFWAVWRGSNGARVSLRHAALAGAALGWALVVEHSALLAALPVGLFALWRLRRCGADGVRAGGVAVLAGAAALLPLVAYNLFAFGTPVRVAYEGVQGFEGMRQGLFGLTYPKLGVLWELLVGRFRGIPWVAPVLVLAPLGCWAALRRGAETGSRDLWVAAAAAAFVPILVNAAYVYWDGGNSTGPRHAVPALPFLAMALAPAWMWMREQWLHALALVLLALSAAVNCAIASAEIMAPAWVPDAVHDAVLRDRFWPGYLRTLPSEWWSWTVWQGLALWAVLALPLVIYVTVTSQALARGRTRT